MSDATRRETSTRPQAGERGTARSPSASARRLRLWARATDVALGCWLFASAFVLPRGEAAGGNAWIVGMLIAVFGLWGIWAPAVRRVNTLAGVWLLSSAFFLPHLGVATRVHDVLIACAVLGLSLVRSEAARMRAYV
jgi:hypothetical protein